MPSVLLPKYNLGQISTNFFNKKQGTSMTKFISDNFTSVPKAINGITHSTPIQQANNKLISQIIIDYGNGPISSGMQSLTLINTNVVTGSIISHDIFNNSILYGASIPFNTVTAEQGRLIVLTNLQMVQILNLVSAKLQQDYNNLIDRIVSDLKKGIYLSSNYSTSLLRQSRIIAQSAAGILNGFNN